MVLYTLQQYILLDPLNDPPDESNDAMYSKTLKIMFLKVIAELI